MRILCLTRYDAAGASSRYRVFQFLPHLRAAGFDINVLPLLGKQYIERLYARRRGNAALLMRAASWRMAHVMRVRRYDLVWMEKELLPFAPAWLERLLRSAGVPVVVDYDDAIFHRYDRHSSMLVRMLLGRKIDSVMASATLVVAGNEYLAARARTAGARAVEVLPTVIDLDRYPATQPSPHTRLTVGWIGSPSTQGYLRQVAPALARFCSESGARFHAIGVEKTFVLEGVPITAVPWTAAGELQALRELDIGIMPLTDSPWERGKCGFKLIQYMASGLPVVASPVGANREIVLDGETGLLAATSEEWVAALRRLADSSALRGRMGGAGRARAEARYSLQVVAPRLLELLRGAAATTPPRRRSLLA